MAKQLKIAGVKMLEPDHYEVRVQRVNPATGRTEVAKRRVRGTLTDAIRARDEAAEELRSGRQPVVARPRVEEYARWWLGTKAHELAPATRAKYEDVVELHLVPKLGRFYLDALSPAHVTNWVKDLAETYSEWTVTNALKTVRTMMSDAMVYHRDIMHHYPCERVRAPKSDEAFSDDDRNLLSAAELGKLLDAVKAKEPYWYTVIVTLAFTGLRWAEVSALRWDDIDTDNEVIKILRKNWRGQLGKPKTKKRREVPLLPTVRDALRAHYDWFEANKMLRRGRPEQWADGEPRKQYEGFVAGWVFPSKRGGLNKGWPVSKVLARLLEDEELGINRRLTGHGLRRTFNDLLRRVAEGQVVRAITGHVTEAMTEHYSHVDRAEKQKAATAVFQVVQGGRS